MVMHEIVLQLEMHVETNMASTLSVDDLMLVVVLSVIMLVVHHDHDDDHLCQKNSIVLFELLVNGSCVWVERFDCLSEQDR